MQVEYQPQVDLESGRIAALDAQVSLALPYGTRLDTAQVFAAAQETGFMIEVGEWVLESSARQLAAWQRQGLPTLTLAVQLSADQFFDDALVKTVERVLHASGTRPEAIELEICERLLAHEDSPGWAVLRELSALGVGLCIDRFSSSLVVLRRLRRARVTSVRLHPDLVSRVLESVEDAAIVEVTVGLAAQFGVDVVASDIDSPDTVAFLASAGCKRAQGNVFSPPLDPAGVASLLREKHWPIDVGTPWMRLRNRLFTVGPEQRQ